MNNRRQIKVTPLKPASWSAPAVRINNMLLNKSEAYSFTIDENRMFRIQLLPGEMQRQNIYSIGLTLGIGDSTAGLWLSDWPTLDDIRAYVPEGMLARLPENLGIALVENALEPLLRNAEKGLSSKISIQSLSVERNSLLYPLPLSFELLEADRSKPEDSNMRTIYGLLMLEERLYPLLQERLRFWPSDENEDWEKLETQLSIEIGQAELQLKEINTLKPGDILLPDTNAFQTKQNVRLRSKNNLYCDAQLSADPEKILTITTGWNTMDENESQQNQNIDQINKVPVQLSFDLGQKTLSFNEVKQLRPGYVLDLPASLPEVIQIKAQNKQIGSGELVEIDGRVGVRIISLFNKR